MIRFAVFLAFSFFAAASSARAAEPPAVSTVTYPPAAEVSASSGPVRLTMRIEKLRVRQDEPVRFQVELTNVSTYYRLLVQDDTLYLEEPRAMTDSLRTRVGTYIEVMGPDGKPLDYALVPHPPENPCPGYSGDMVGLESGRPLTKEEEAWQAKLLRKWKKAGYGRKMIEERLDKAWIARQEAIREARLRKRNVLLEPGESIRTPALAAWADTRTICGPMSSWPPAKTPYADLIEYPMGRTGVYSLRAVYDHGLPEGLAEEYRRAGLQAFPENVVIRTSPVVVEVVR